VLWLAAAAFVPYVLTNMHIGEQLLPRRDRHVAECVIWVSCGIEARLTLRQTIAWRKKAQSCSRTSWARTLTGALQATTRLW
jgi:hypothetical protein